MNKYYELNPEVEHPKLTKLKQDCPTRWNSAFLMLQSIDICHEQIRSIINSDQKIKVNLINFFLSLCSIIYLKFSFFTFIQEKNRSKLLSNDELDLIKDLCTLLAPFYEFTKRLSSTKYVTISVVLPALTHLMDILNVIEFSDLLKPIGESLYVDLEHRSAQYFASDVILAATFMDQRFKKFRFIK